MTKTEDRLTEALTSAAAAVRVESARPLVAPGQNRPGQARPRELTGPAHRRRAQLGAASAAAAVVAAVVAVAALSGQRPLPGPVQADAYLGGAQPHVPAFFVDAGNFRLYDGNLRVISLATGAVTSTEHAPAGTTDVSFLAEQPQTGNFIAAFIRSGGTRGLQLYRFRITGTGQITPLTLIKGVLLRQQPENVLPLALSPDGSRLAVAETANTIPTPNGTAPSKVIVLNLNDGSRQVWKDRLTDRHHWPQITSAAWTPDGKALVFASHICSLNPGASPCSWEFRKLTKASGELQAGPVLLHQDGMSSEIQAPGIAPDGGSVIEIRSGNAPGADAMLVRISLAAGSQMVLHRLPAPGPYQVGPNVGNFLFIGQRNHPGSSWRLAGWVDDAGFHPLHLPPAP